MIPEDFRQQTDARELIARIVDGSRFQELKQLYGETLVGGFGRNRGFPVGSLANNGRVLPEPAEEGATCVERGCARG